MVDKKAGEGFSVKVSLKNNGSYAWTFWYELSHFRVNGQSMPGGALVSRAWPIGAGATDIDITSGAIPFDEVVGQETLKAVLYKDSSKTQIVAQATGTINIVTLAPSTPPPVTVTIDSIA